MELNLEWLEALHTSYLGEYKKANATLQLYLSSPQAVAGHADLFEDLDKLVTEVAELKSKMEILQGVLRTYEQEKARRATAAKAKAESIRLAEADNASKLEQAKESKEAANKEKPAKKASKTKRAKKSP